MGLASSVVVTHDGVTCDVCHASPITGTRYKCVTCKNYDMCQTCESYGQHAADHPLIKMRQPQHPKNSGEGGGEEEEDSDDENEDAQPHKMVLIIRTDLKMQKGKAAAQCSHATLGVYKKALKQNKQAVDVWSSQGQAKITLQVPNEIQMEELASQAKAAGMVNYTVADAGRTQVAAGSHTVLAIGPAPSAEIDKITRHLKLY